MKILIIIAMVIIFISAFFIFFIYEATLKEHLACFVRGQDDCKPKSPLSAFILGLSMAVFLFVIDIAVFYILLRILQSSPSEYAG